jgi:hypothetical protein
MRAVRAVEGSATVVMTDEPGGDWPVLEVGSASICGSARCTNRRILFERSLVHLLQI